MVVEISSTTRDALVLNDLEWVREALRGPATRTWWGRGPDDALVRITGVGLPGAEGGGSVAVERAFQEALSIWGAEASPPLQAATTPEGRVVALCRVEHGAQTLADRLQEGALEPEDALDCVMQIAERLTGWHERGLAHGFLRPETVLCHAGGVALLEPRLHAVAADAYSRFATIPTGDLYAAPEAERFATDALAADVFALGMLLVHMLVGRAPRLSSQGGLEGTPIYEALPGPLQRTVAAVLHPDAAQRVPAAQKLGLYLRVHRMWAASWDWAPLAVLAATPAETALAAATLGEPPAVLTTFRGHAAPVVAAASPEAPGAPEETGVADSRDAEMAAERVAQFPLTAVAAAALPAMAAVVDTPVATEHSLEEPPVVAVPPASISTPAPPLPTVSTTPATTDDAEAELVWPSWLPRPRLELPHEPAAPAEIVIPTELATSFEPLAPTETAAVAPPDPPSPAVPETSETRAADSVADPAPSHWAEGGWKLDTVLRSPDEEVPPLSIPASAAEEDAEGWHAALPAADADVVSWHPALPVLDEEREIREPLATEEPERRSRHLIVHIHAGRHQEEVVLEGERAGVGRPDPARDHYPEVDLHQDDAISRRHAEFRRGPAGWVLLDLGSTNGTRLNGEWLEPHREAALRDGDQIELGAVTTLRVHFG